MLPHSSPAWPGGGRGTPGSPSLPPTAGQRGTTRKHPSWLPLLGTCVGPCGAGLGGMQLLGGAGSLKDWDSSVLLSPGWEPQCSGHTGCSGRARGSPWWWHRGIPCLGTHAVPPTSPWSRWERHSAAALRGRRMQSRAGRCPAGRAPATAPPDVGCAPTGAWCPHAVPNPCCAPTSCIPGLCAAISRVPIPTCSFPSATTIAPATCPHRLPSHGRVTVVAVPLWGQHRVTFPLQQDHTGLLEPLTASRGRNFLSK